jgi:hypothetical protein
MRLTDEEQAMRAGRFGPAVQWAIEHQIKVGEYLGAGDFVPVLCQSRDGAENDGEGAGREGRVLGTVRSRSPARASSSASGSISELRARAGSFGVIKVIKKNEREASRGKAAIVTRALPRVG